MGKPAIEYQKMMTEIVYVNLPGPKEPSPGMTGGELLHGFLTELHEATSNEVQAYLGALCSKWNVRFRKEGGTGGEK